MFEALVSLAILSLVLAIGATAVGPPSPALQAKATAANLIQTAGEFRLQAISEGVHVIWVPDADACDEDTQVEFTFFPDGSGRGADICIGTAVLSLHRVTGILYEAKS